MNACKIIYYYWLLFTRALGESVSYIKLREP